VPPHFRVRSDAFFFSEKQARSGVCHVFLFLGELKNSMQKGGERSSSAEGVSFVGCVSKDSGGEKGGEGTFNEINHYAEGREFTAKSRGKGGLLGGSSRCERRTLAFVKPASSQQTKK